MTTDVSYRKSCVPCVQRGRICNPNCVFLPYFPWSRSTEYWSALRLLGFARICKIMNSVDASERKPAAESILALGRAWVDDPVHGSVGTIRKLIEEIRFHQKELETVNQQLEYYRGRGEEKLNPRSADPPPLMQQASPGEGEDAKLFDADWIFNLLQEDPPLADQASTSKLEESSPEQEAFQQDLNEPDVRCVWCSGN